MDDTMKTPRDAPGPPNGGAMCGAQTFRVRTERPPGGGQLDPARSSIEQPDTQDPFEALHRLGQGGLGHGKPLGGPANVAFFGHRKELLEQSLSQFHIRHHMKAGAKKYWTIWPGGR
nr:hypothetical protein [Mycobacterium scrofulaceum]